MLLLWHRSTAQAGSATPTAHPVGAGPALFHYSPLGQLITLSHSQAGSTCCLYFAVGLDGESCTSLSLPRATSCGFSSQTGAHSLCTPFPAGLGAGTEGILPAFKARVAITAQEGTRTRGTKGQLAPGHRRLAPPSPSSRPRGAPGAGVSWALGLTYFSLTHISCGRHPSRAARGPALIAPEGGNEVGRDIALSAPTPLPFPNVPPSSDSDKEPVFNKQHPKEQRGQVLNPLSVLLLVASPGFQRTSPSSLREATLQRGLD